ncbi:MAG: bifunctional aspartate kinase/homoserine dehydrogenase I [Candidatus Cyclonatronum sp.]|uniref:bifunctional aspartate kinase/homoserine dehydrogenase I n=1 Tax=Cyclonatronum sp. TaxID=3024185 RepID=UPI0025BB0013|nr:bifunctional aspartate kinase/homoserine dehydrogenase I [Cyclonatronum sp.]MCH8485693.1 bifunctional aspartate kinase/homoserine dehydrogenase I [Cyclonatronum sp.]
MRILKFGGSSVATPQRILDVVNIVSKARERNCRAVVFSAFGGVTDQLIAMARQAESGDEDFTRSFKELELRHISAARELISVANQSQVMGQVKMMLNELEDVLQGIQLVGEFTPRTLDFIMSFGERLSNYIISRTLTDRGIPAGYLDARTVIRTDDRFGQALADMETTRELLGKHFAKHPEVQIVTGFIGSTNKGVTTTLGRGGSDLTASILGACLDAEAIEIWTDVSGIMTADPRKVRKAFPVQHVTYEEAQEMSHFGAKVIYPPTMQPAMAQNIPIWIKNTFAPDAIGTLVSGEPDKTELPVKGISSIGHVALVRVQGAGMIGVVGVAQRIFGALAKAGINTILISQASSEHSVCFAVSPEQAALSRQVIMAEFDFEVQRGRISDVIVEDNMCVVAVVGENMRSTPGIAGKVFQALGRNGVNVSAIAQGSSELNISVVISRKDEQKALIAIHDAFFLSGLKTVNLFFIGVGLIGSTAIDMLHKQREKLRETLKVDLRIIGMCNSRKMLFDLNGLDDDGWKQQLEAKGGPMTPDTFLKHTAELNLPNSIIVDCTSSEEIASAYERILKNSISIVTPNKKACSGSMSRYLALHREAARRDVSFLYETNVGAGLPLIKTLQEMHHTGDSIHSVEGVLSGTLSYLFNEYDGSRPFSQLVAEAREKGFTEPDPRDDLNGMDVARKLLILAREIGLSLELADISMEPLLPASLFEAPDTETFLKDLPSVDDAFKARYEQARDAGKKLRYIAKVDANGARISLQQVEQSHPCYGLQSTDNLILIHSDCYSNRPMVVAGPGAGPKVTASGVVADIIKSALR